LEILEQSPSANNRLSIIPFGEGGWGLQAAVHRDINDYIRGSSMEKIFRNTGLEDKIKINLGQN
jgi:hypothetical protein